MYAVIETGGKQYRIAQGDVIEIERAELSGKAKNAIRFDRVLMISGDKGVQVGDPVVGGAKVTGKLLDEIRGQKIVVFKKKRRKGYKVRRGHRQELMRVEIQKITA
ncbi:MAG: 50S ribosomal protein L21 [Thermoanaerobaculia bacterium]